ncbi:7TM diverse intracellular signaling domain-containing protein [Desulfocurvibacter africanus]|uniref:histidine kinase n=2 Tax=Desulfocurvibacter africanus TaxID=873 RepID=F3Z390_DESAF|nr:7TM diverse intracellular signaling domain-containing protein [Desulfocurvibacter africanus]EGJ50334.1 multi-sensor signal transduction histidine kinase [Desulfocurvibacter africanus subsp. africanus str. Walvis Bay]
MTTRRSLPYRAHFLRFALLCAILLCALLLQACQPDICEHGSCMAHSLALHGFTELSERMDFLEDPSRTMTIQDVASPRTEGMFAPLVESYRRFEPGLNVWLRLPLRPEDVLGADGQPVRDWVLVLEDVYYDRLSLYLPNTRHPGQWMVKETGRSMFHPHGHLAIPFALGPEPDIRAAQGEPLYLYIRVQNSFHYLKKLFLFESQSYYNALVVWNVLLGVFYGVMLLMAPLALLLFLVTRDRGMLWFSLLLVFLTAFFVLDNNFLDRLLKNWNHEEVNLLYSLVLAAMIYSATKFTRAFLMTARTAPVLDKLLRLYGLLGLSAVLVAFLHNPKLLDMWLNFLGLAAPFAVIGTGIWCRIKGFKPARFFLMAVSFFPLGTCVYILADMNLLPRNVLTMNSFQIGTMLMAASMSLALLDRIRELRRESENLEQARRAAVEALEERDRRVRAIFDQSFQFMSLLDAQGRVLEINRSVLEHHEIKREDIIGRPLSEVDPHFNPARREILRDALARAGQGEFMRFELSQHGNHVDISIKPVFGEDGKVQLMVAEGRDVTELHRVQQQMYHADKMAALGRIIAGVAHEINNPNNFIYFNLPVLRDYLLAIRAELDECLKERPEARIMNMLPEDLMNDVFQLLEDMEHGSRRITGIVDELKNYIRGQGEDEEMRPESLATVSGQVMTLVGKQVRKSVGALTVDVPADLPRVVMHPGRIEQVLINLLINASQALEGVPHAEAAIVLRARADGTGMVRMDVEDNGPGIPPEILSSVFEPFFTTKGKQHGTGLGLAISQRIAEEHGGSLAVDSRPDRTVFSLRLPAAKE